MRHLDYPPVWTLAALALVWGQARMWPQVWPLGGDMVGATMALVWAGGALIAAGLALMGLAALTMVRARTTVIPHKTPQHLVSSGIFSLSRNPIYLGDLLVLGGAALIWAAPLGLILVPVLARVLTRRFIEPEEARLIAAFGDTARAYMARTRRWL